MTNKQTSIQQGKLESSKWFMLVNNNLMHHGIVD